MIKKISSILNNYGIKWSINRSLYSFKLKILKIFKFSEKLFEKDIKIKNLDLFEFNIPLIQKYYGELSQAEIDKIIDKANKAIEGKIMAFSSLELEYGNPINWHYNPMTKSCHSKNEKWFIIPDFDKNVGDIKVIWEINRLTHFLDFAKAYIITNDIKYYDAFESQIKSWLEENQYSYGSNYKCGQEATLRMINVLMSYSVFKEFDLVSKEVDSNIKKIVEGSYKKVLSNFFYAHKCIINNHTFTEILGRIVGAWSTNDNKELKKSMKLMDLEIVRQFTSDGGFKQYSYNYHRFTLQIFEVLFKIEEKIGYEIKETNRINKSIIKLYNLTNSQGFIPNYGSNDGALIFPFSNSDYRDYRPTLNAIFTQINGSQLYDRDILTEEVIWFTNFDSHPKINLPKESMNLKEIGVYTFKDENTLALVHLNDYKSRPAHMDQLHFELWFKDTDVLCDLGTYSYASELGNQLSLNVNHNTVSLPRKPQMNKLGTFLVYDWTKVKNEPLKTNKIFRGEFVSRNNYTHERVINRREYGFDIIDEVNSKEEHFYINFNTPIKPIIDNEKILLILDDESRVIISHQGTAKIKQQKRSLYYLKTQDIYKIEIEIKGKEIASTQIILVG